MMKTVGLGTLVVCYAPSARVMVESRTGIEKTEMRIMRMVVLVVCCAPSARMLVVVMVVSCAPSARLLVVLVECCAPSARMTMLMRMMTKMEIARDGVIRMGEGGNREQLISSYVDSE